MPTLSPSSEDVRVYEIAIMYAPDMPQKEEQALLKEIQSILSEAESKDLFTDQWSKRGLAYPIGGHEEAKFIIMYCEMDPAKIREVEAALRIERNILRHLILIPPTGYEARSFEDGYKDWLNNRESAADQRKQAQEQKIKDRVQAKAKMEARKMEARKKKERKDEDDSGAEKKDISGELDKLISDDDLDI